MNKKTVFILMMMLLALASVSMAGSERRVGSAGAQELQIPIGSRGTAMGGAISADAMGTEAIFYNPAGVAFTRGTEVMFSHLKYFADMDLNYFALTKSFEDFGAIGISAKILSVGDIIKTTSEMSGPEGTGETFNPTFAVIGLTYSRIMTDRVTFGITGSLISESVDRASATGMALDFGINYDTKWRGLRIGIVAKNVGPEMRFAGAGFSYDGRTSNLNPVSPDKTFQAQSAKFELPSYIQFGAAMDFYNIERNRATAYGSFQSNNFSKDLWRFGAEYSFDEKYFLRAGYSIDDRQVDYLYGMAFGAGVVFNFGTTDLTLEYSWNETQFFDNIQYFTGKVNF
ncbi:MAG: PorV/PorQ family protein [candidate division Zixibacteria bacterium]|nr:PorV/PorQ family protein [candidate division Zixibacteria bacterium]